MATIYDFDEKDPIFSIEAHYFNDGWDVKGFAFGDETGEKGDTIVIEATGEFSEDLINNVEDVFCGSVATYVVAYVPDDEGTSTLLVFEMSTEDFKANWSERIWAKFRMDSYTHVCPECGQKMAHSVAGQTMSDIGRIEQFHCDNCHYTWVGYQSGKFIREGVLHSSWDVR